MGAPYLYCMGNVRDFTDEQLRTIAREVHNVGCYVGYAGCYEPPQNNQKLLDMGFDFSASGWDINEIDNGNLCNLTADLRFDDFRTDGTEREAVLCLDAGQSVAPGVELPSEFLSGGSLHVRFEGKSASKWATTSTRNSPRTANVRCGGAPTSSSRLPRSASRPSNPPASST